jgi:hypothetical protein
VRTDRAWRVPAGCLSLVVCGLLAACGADSEPASHRAVATTPKGTATAADVSTIAAGATPPAAGTSTTAATAATPGVGTEGTPGTNGSGNTCSNAVGLRASQSAQSADASSATPADMTTPTTTPEDATTTPAGATTPADATATPADATATPQDATTTPATTTPADPTTDGEITADQATIARPFSPTSPWNTPIDTRAVDPRSADWIARASRRVAVVVSTNRRSVATTERTAPDLKLYVNTCAWTPTIVSEDGGEPVRIVCRQRNCGPVAKQVTTLRVPPGIDPFPEFDGWFSVIDQAAGVGYDMWRARRVGNVISYQFIKRWPLNGPGYSAPAVQDPTRAVGARGSGLPLFAGVIQPSELRAGRIDHALAISVPGPAQRIFVQPASVTNGINVINSLPEGARLRLKSSFTAGEIPHGANRRSAQTIITALRTYGAIVVDRSITPTLYARRSTGYGSLLIGDEVQDVKLSDFEVVQTGPLLRYPPLDATAEAVQG